MNYRIAHSMRAVHDVPNVTQDVSIALSKHRFVQSPVIPICADTDVDGTLFSGSPTVSSKQSDFVLSVVHCALEMKKNTHTV